MRSLDTFNLFVAAFAALQCFRYARRALLFAFPSVRIWGEPGAGPRSARRLRVGARLEELGFTPLGIQHQRGAMGAFALEADAYAAEERRTFADVVEGRRGDAPGVLFFTPFEGGAAVLTAGFPRRAIATERVQAGGIPDAPLEAVLAAHEVAVERFAARHGPPAVVADLEARLAAARTWSQGEGRREMRRAHAPGFAIMLFGLVLFASAVNILMRGAR
jgi:hypothetical protein